MTNIISSPPSPINSSGDTNKNCFYCGSGSAGGRVIQAPMLRRYAATSACLLMMAHLSAVPPPLQGR